MYKIFIVFQKSGVKDFVTIFHILRNFVTKFLKIYLNINYFIHKHINMSVQNLNSKLICPDCSKLFQNKYNLEYHCRRLHQKSTYTNQSIEIEKYNCISSQCQYVTSIKQDMKKHIDKCVYVMIDKQVAEKEEIFRQQLINIQIQHDLEIVKRQSLYDSELARKDAEIAHLQGKLECLDSQIDKSHQLVSKLAERPNVNEMEEDDEELIQSTVNERLEDCLTASSDIPMITLSTMKWSNVSITSRHPDHYVNATEICQAGGKKFFDWARLESTKELITVLSSEAGIPVSLLVETKRGQTSKFRQGTWIHPDLAIQLAQWISPAFALHISRWIRQLFDAGKVTIDVSLMKLQQKRIEHLEQFLSKKRRIVYDGKNVIYILTTEDHRKRRIYIVGKTVDLTDRLGVYNKTVDHCVEYYRSCASEEEMDLIEVMVLKRLDKYREQSNRDRFVLPIDEDISLFTQIVDECVDFFKI